MDLVDRSVIPSLHAAARQHRSAYVSCLLKKAFARVAAFFTIYAHRTAPCA